MNGKSILLFDLDGTLTDPKEGIIKSYQYALTAFGLQAETGDLLKHIGPPLRNVFTDHYGFSPSDVDKAVTTFREYFARTGLLENKVYPGIPELLRKLKALGKTLAVATNKPAPFAKRVLEHFGLTGYFSFVSGDDMDGSLAAQGKQEIIRIALDNLGVMDLSTAVMIGDRKHDIMGANVMGLDSIGVLYGYGNREELAGAGATAIVDQVTDLTDLLLKG